jgi:hypothetical protein
MDEHGLPQQDPRRRTMPAGHVLVALFIGLVVAALLNAQGMHKQALAQGPGIGRDIAGTLTAGLAGVSGIFQIDEPRKLLKAALGRSGDDKLVGKLAITAKGPAATAAPTKPVYSAAKPMGLYLTGDSLITDPGPVLLDKISTNPAIKPLGVTDAHAATGLVQPEVFNWFDYLPQQIKALKPDMTVATFGANDGLGFTGVAGADEFGTPAWLAEYARRVGGVMDLITAKGGQLVMLGLPIPRDPALAARWAKMNQIQKSEATKRKGLVAYVDLFDKLKDAKGKYADFLPDSNRQLQRARSSDGIHYEPLGAMIVTDAIIDAINSLATVPGLGAEPVDGATVAP